MSDVYWPMHRKQAYYTSNASLVSPEGSFRFGSGDDAARTHRFQGAIWAWSIKKKVPALIWAKASQQAAAMTQ